MYRVGEWEEQMSVWGHSSVRTESASGMPPFLGQTELLHLGEMTLQTRALTQRTQALFLYPYQVAHSNSSSRESDTP